MKKIILTLSILLLGAGCNDSVQTTANQPFIDTYQTQRAQCLDQAQTSYNAKIEQYHQWCQQNGCVPGWVNPDVASRYNNEFQNDKETCLGKFPIPAGATSQVINP